MPFTSYPVTVLSFPFDDESNPVPSGSPVNPVPIGSPVNPVPAGSPVNPVPIGSPVNPVPAGSPVNQVPAGCRAGTLPDTGNISRFMHLYTNIQQLLSKRQYPTAKFACPAVFNIIQKRLPARYPGAEFTCRTAPVSRRWPAYSQTPPGSSGSPGAWCRSRGLRRRLHRAGP